MKKYKRMIAIGVSFAMAAGMYGCAGKQEETKQDGTGEQSIVEQSDSVEESGGSQADAGEKEYIEQALNLADNEEQEWTYSKDADAWTLSFVSAVAYPELPNQQGVSVCPMALTDSPFDIHYQF